MSISTLTIYCFHGPHPWSPILHLTTGSSFTVLSSVTVMSPGEGSSAGTRGFSCNDSQMFKPLYNVTSAVVHSSLMKEHELTRVDDVSPTSSWVVTVSTGEATGRSSFPALSSVTMSLPGKDASSGTRGSSFPALSVMAVSPGKDSLAVTRGSTDFLTAHNSL